MGLDDVGGDPGRMQRDGAGARCPRKILSAVVVDRHFRMAHLVVASGIFFPTDIAQVNL